MGLDKENTWVGATSILVGQRVPIRLRELIAAETLQEAGVRGCGHVGDIVIEDYCES